MSSVEQRARELMAAEYLDDPVLAEKIRTGGRVTNGEVHRAIRAIAAALREQPEARGVVDELTEIRDEALRCANADTIGGDTDALKRAMRRLADRCDAALTAAQQPVQEGGGARLTNPWTGEPRDYRDVNSDPAGTLCVEPGAPLKAAPPTAPVGLVEAATNALDWIAAGPEGKRAHDALRRALTAAQQPAPPSAPVGVQEGACPECGSTDKVEDVNGVLVCGNHFCGSEPWKHPEYEARKREPAAAPPSAPVGVDLVELGRLLVREREAVGGAFTPDWLLFREALTQQPAQAAPGWKLVPVEPTEAMLRVGVDAAVAASPRPWCPVAWAAMLAATPTPPGDDAAGGG